MCWSASKQQKINSLKLGCPTFFLSQRVTHKCVFYRRGLWNTLIFSANALAFHLAFLSKTSANPVEGLGLKSEWWCMVSNPAHSAATFCSLAAYSQTFSCYRYTVSVKGIKAMSAVYCILWSVCPPVYLFFLWCDALWLAVHLVAQQWVLRCYAFRVGLLRDMALKHIKGCLRWYFS